MESNLPGQSYIEKITQIFREEGDVETVEVMSAPMSKKLSFISISKSKALLRFIFSIGGTKTIFS